MSKLLTGKGDHKVFSFFYFELRNSFVNTDYSVESEFSNGPDAAVILSYKG